MIVKNIKSHEIKIPFKVSGLTLQPNQEWEITKEDFTEMHKFVDDEVLEVVSYDDEKHEYVIFEEYTLHESATGPLKYKPLAVTAQDTLAALPFTPLNPLNICLIVESVPQENGVDFTVSGTTITWSFVNAGFHLETTDKVFVLGE